MFKDLHLSVGTRLHESLTKKEVEDDLWPFIISLFPKLHGESIPKSSDPREIFEAITCNQLLDYRTCSPLEQIIQRFCGSDPEITGKMEQYKKSLEQFQQTALTTVSEHS